MNSVLFIFVLECSLLWSKLWRVYLYSLDIPSHGQPLTHRARFSAAVNQSSESKSIYLGWFTPAKALARSLDCWWLLKGGTNSRCHPRKRTAGFPSVANAQCFPLGWIQEAQDFHQCYSGRICFPLSWEGIFFAPFCCSYRHRKREGNSSCCRAKYSCFVVFFPFSRGDHPWGNDLKDSLVATGFTAACFSA